MEPAEDQATTFPWSSAIEIIVLLKVALTNAIPVVIFFLIFFLITLGLIFSLATVFVVDSLTIFFSFAISLLLTVSTFSIGLFLGVIKLFCFSLIFAELLNIGFFFGINNSSLIISATFSTLFSSCTELSC